MTEPLKGYEVERQLGQDPEASVPAFVGVLQMAAKPKPNDPVQHYGTTVSGDMRGIIPDEEDIKAFRRSKSKSRSKAAKLPTKKKASRPHDPLSAWGICRDFYRAVKAQRPEFKLPREYTSYETTRAAQLADDMKEDGCLNEITMKAFMQWHVRRRLANNKPMEYHASLRSLLESWRKFKPLAPRTGGSDEAGAKLLNVKRQSQAVTGGIGGDIQKALTQSGGLSLALAVYGVICVGHALMQKHDREKAIQLIADALVKAGHGAKAIYRRSAEYDLSEAATHPLAKWREIFKDAWKGCSEPASAGSKRQVVEALVNSPV